MKQTFLLFAFVIFSFFTLHTQTTLYTQTFDGVTVPALPSGWSSTSSTTATIGQISGDATGNTLFMANCQPSGQSRSVTVSGISTVGWSSISISFDQRVTNAFDVPVTLAWSIDGTNWTTISSYSTPGTAGSWESWSSGPLPSGLENQANVRFRWSWTTDNNNGCTTATPNFRINDFIVTADVLPVTFLYLKTENEGRQNRLSFSTATEHNNSHFSIERSADGSVFQEIGRVTGKGNSNTKQAYTYTDQRPLKGINYYRLRQVDFDGTAVYSPVVSVINGRTTGITLAPSPAVDLLKVRFEEAVAEDGRYEIYDMAGRLVLHGEVLAESNELTIAVAELTAGIYALRVTHGRSVAMQMFLR